MALIKSRPKVRARVPNEIRPGDHILATVICDCKREIEVASVDVVLTATEGWRTGSGDNAVSRSQTLLNLGARLSGRRVLPAGQTELSVRIPLPKEAPPSYRGTAATIEYELNIHVAIPWWPDRRASFEIHVAPPARPSPEQVPQVFSSDPEGPRGTEPHAELSVASSWTRVGDVVTGALALSNVGQNRYSEIKVGLRGVETIYDGGTVRSQHDALRYQIRLGAEEASEGEMIPFRFRLPDEAHADLAHAPRPGGLRGLAALHWQLELIVGVRWGSDLTLRVPFAVLPASSRPGDAPSRLAPPTVGSDRLRAVWEDIGRGLGLTYEAQTLWGAFGETSLVIRRDHAGRNGIFLLAEVRYPELHLSLEVQPATSVQKMVRAGARIGDPAWDRDHCVLARDAAQVSELLRQLIPAMQNASLRRLDDRMMTVAVRDAGQSRARMQRFCAAAVALARAMEEARRNVPPPPAMRGALEEWRELARRLDAELETSRMRIEGQSSLLPAEVRLAFDAGGQPLSTWLSVRTPSALDEEHRFRFTRGDPDSSLEARFRGEALELMRVITKSASEVEIVPERVSVGLDMVLGVYREQSPMFTAAAAEQRLSRMVRLIAILRGQAGPYR